MADHQKREAFQRLYLFWLKVFAISFGMGVVTGVVMSYQFGTNWSVFSRATAGVIGPLLAFEVLTAFFLESSFLGVMLFGWKRVGPRADALRGDLPRGVRHPGLGVLDHLRQQLGCRSSSGYAPPPANGRFIAAANWMRVIFSPTFPDSGSPTWCWPPT